MIMIINVLILIDIIATIIGVFIVRKYQSRPAHNSSSIDKKLTNQSARRQPAKFTKQSLLEDKKEQSKKLESTRLADYIRYSELNM